MRVALFAVVAVFAVSAMNETVDAVHLSSRQSGGIAGEGTTDLSQTGAQAEASVDMVQMIIKLIELIQRPTLICNGGPAADHKSKINLVDLHKDKYVLHEHDGKGGTKTSVSSGRKRH